MKTDTTLSKYIGIFEFQWALLLSRFNFNLSMDK